MKTCVVTGMGIVSPVGPDRETTWQAIKQGRSGVALLSGLDLPEMEDAVGAQVPREWLDGADRDRDPFIRFALKAAAEAITDAGLPLTEMDRSRVGCFVGSSKGGVSTFHEEMARRSSGKPFEQMLLREFLPDAAGLAVAETHDLRGPCGNIVGACATGALCIARGAELIQDDICDVVLAGASDASITPAMIGGFDRLTLLARGNGEPARACRPFDVFRGGFALGEGACVLVLEEAASARDRGAEAYGVVSGWASASSALNMTALDPDGTGIAMALRLAMQKGGVKGHELGYINAHGTATRQNDVAETRAVKAVLGRHAHSTPISSTKPVTGHLLGAAGSLEFALALLAMRDGFLPPTINLDVPDPECDLDYVPNKGRPAAIRHCASLSAGLGGSVCALVAASCNGASGVRRKAPVPSGCGEPEPAE